MSAILKDTGDDSFDLTGDGESKLVLEEDFSPNGDTGDSFVLTRSTYRCKNELLSVISAVKLLYSSLILQNAVLFVVIWNSFRN